MSYPIGTIGIVVNDKKRLTDNAIEILSGGQGGHAFLCVGKNQVFEMNCPKGAIFRSLDDYNTKRHVVLMASPRFLTRVDTKIILDICKNWVKEKVKYDYKGILGQLLKIPDKINKKNRYYCSEAIASMYCIASDYCFMGLDPKIVTPHDIEYHVRSCQYDWECSFLSEF